MSRSPESKVLERISSRSEETVASGERVRTWVPAGERILIRILDTWQL